MGRGEASVHAAGENGRRSSSGRSAEAGTPPGIALPLVLAWSGICSLPADGLVCPWGEVSLNSPRVQTQSDAVAFPVADLASLLAGKGLSGRDLPPPPHPGKALELGCPPLLFPRPTAAARECSSLSRSPVAASLVHLLARVAASIPLPLASSQHGYRTSPGAWHPPPARRARQALSPLFPPPCFSQERDWFFFFPPASDGCDGLDGMGFLYGSLAAFPSRAEGL